MDSWRSKLNAKYNKQDIEKWDCKLKAQLKALQQHVDNRRCFDCGVADVTWASPKLGIFICVACSDVHRAAGAHITCVKNFHTYLWGPDEVALMSAIGNKRGRELYGQETVSPSATKNAKVDYCTRKYGCDRVQQLAASHVANAKARADQSPNVEAPAVNHAEETPTHETPTHAKKADIQDAPSADFFDVFFDSVFPAEANKQETGARKSNLQPQEVEEDLFASSPPVPLPGFRPGRNAGAALVPTRSCCDEQHSMDDFLAMCNPPVHNLATQVLAGEDLFAGWEAWK